MTTEEFVKRIKTAVYESSIKGTLLLLDQPPGRRPSKALVDLSHWFNRLLPEDKEHIRATIQLAVGNAIFGMLTVLDGERSIRNAEEKKGSLELRYNTEGQTFLLNDPEGEPLHDIFNDLVPLG